MSDPEPLTTPAELVFRGTLTEDDVVHLQQYHDLLRLGRPVRWIARCFLVFLAAACAFVMYVRGPAILPASVFVGCVYLLLIFQPERRWMARRHYRRNKGDYVESTVRLTGERLLLSNELRQSSFPWQDVRVVADTPLGLLFCNRYLQPVLWLPNRAFDEADTRYAVTEMARRAGVEVRRLM